MLFRISKLLHVLLCTVLLFNLGHFRIQVSYDRENYQGICLCYPLEPQALSDKQNIIIQFLSIVLNLTQMFLNLRTSMSI